MGARVFAREQGVRTSIRESFVHDRFIIRRSGAESETAFALECERLRQQAERDAEALFDERRKARVRRAWLPAR